MYLARLTAGDSALVQGGVRISYPAAGAGMIAGYGASDYWVDTLRALARAVTSAAPLSFSLRVMLDAQGDLAATIGALTEAVHEDALRRWLAGFTRLERAVPGTVALPLERAEFDDFFADPGAGEGAWRFARTSAPEYRRNELWVACDFQLLPHLAELLLEARHLGHALLLQVNLTSFSASHDQVREARRNIVRLGDSGRAPQLLLDVQSALATRLGDAAYVVEEFVGSTQRAVESWLRTALDDRFKQQYQRLPFETPVYRFVPWHNIQGLDPPLHSSLLDPAQILTSELCATAQDAAAPERILAWMPPNALRFVPPAAPPDEPAVAPNVLPPSMPGPVRAGRGEYVFISYAHSDATHVAPHLRALSDAAVPFWYDAGIPSGAEWDSVIEARIEACLALLVFVSPRAVASKYVRREVKFADALNKPLLSIVLEPAPLREGLRMLLTQYQMIDAAAADIVAAVRQAVAQPFS